MKEPFISILNYDLKSLYKYVSETPQVKWGLSESGNTPLQLAFNKGSALIGATIIAFAPERIREVKWTYQELIQSLIEEYSEESLCSGWNQDIECILWAVINHEYSFHEDDRLNWLPEEIMECILTVAKQGNTWSAWRENMDFIEHMPMSKWLPLYDSWKNENS